MTGSSWRRGFVAGVATLVSLGCVGLKRCAYEGVGRDGWQQPEQVVESLGIRSGDRIADLGSGTGYFTFRLADAAGPDGRVYAVDIDEQLVEHLAERARDDGYANVETVLAKPDDPGLSEGSVDLIFNCNTYHHLPDRVAYFERLRPLLRPGGRIAIVEHRPGFWHWLFPHATEPEQIRSELEKAGFELAQEHDYLSEQSFLIFTPVH